MSEERFAPTNGRIIGFAGIGLGVLLIGYGIVGNDPGFRPWLYVVSALLVVLSWVFLLRPAIRISSDKLVMRQPLSTVAVPLAAIDSFSIDRFVLVQEGGRRWINSAVHRSRVGARRGGAADGRQRGVGMPTGPSKQSPSPSYAQYVEEKVRQQIDQSIRRTRRDGAASTAATTARPRADATVSATAGDNNSKRPSRAERRWAWPEIIAIAVLAVALVVTLLV